MTCNFTDGLDPKLGQAMVEQHWAANSDHMGPAGQREVLEKTTTVLAQGVAETISGPPRYALDLQECDDPRWDQDPFHRRT